MKTNIINVNGVDVELEGIPSDNSVTTQKVADKAITKAKLADAVQASLDKADTALQSSDLNPYRTSQEQDAIDNGKVDKVTGKGLSTNDYDNTEKGKVATALQPSALNPYRTAANQDVIDNAIKDRATAIEVKIPSQASSSNQLADKNFVNSSIATETATFRGTSASGLTEAQFLAWANGLTKDGNDYVFWNTADSSGNVQFKRYKYNGTAWVYEYTLNNSSFTSAQWAAINSGLTGTDKTALDAALAFIGTFGNIVTHNVAEFATAAQGAKADSALQPSALTPYRTAANQDVIDNSKVAKTDIVDNLDSTDATKVLSAKQGGHLVEYIDQSITNAIAYVDQQDNAEHDGRVAGDNLLDNRKANKDGYYQSLSVGLADRAGDLNIDNGTFVHKQTVPMETTGGDDSLRDGEAKVHKVYGTTDGISAAGAKIIGSSFNLIPSGSGTVFTFLAVKGEWGQYRSAEKNNGYLFVSENNVILTPLSVKQNGVAVPAHTEDGKTFFLPPADGEVTVTFTESQNNPCAHICWSNERDNAYVEYNPSEVDLSGIITAMGGVLRKAGLVVDEIDFTLGKSFQRLDAVTLKNLTWSMTEGPDPEEGQERINIFRASVSGMKSGGAIESKIDGIALASEGTQAVCYNTATSVSAFVALLGNGVAWYEKSSATERTFSVSGDIIVNDYGITMLTNTAGVVTANIDYEFHKNWRDDAKNLPQIVGDDELVTAHALTDLYEQLLSPTKHNVLREDIINEFKHGNWGSDKVVSAKLLYELFEIVGTQSAEFVSRALIHFLENGAICAGIAPAYRHGDCGAVGDIRTWNGYLWKCDVAQSSSYDLDETKWHKTTLVELINNQN